MTPDERAAATLPDVAALICAVHDHDADQVADILAKVTDWQAMAVVLASLVPTDVPMPAVATPELVAATILQATAIRFCTTVDAIRSPRRDRATIDARATAQAAMRYAGLTSTFIGQQTCRDHSTVLHAASRIGENARLRAVALELADLVGRSDVLGDEVAA